MMRKFLMICSFASLIACDEDPGYKISGTLNNSTDGQKVYISELDAETNQPKTIDTVEVTNGEFELDLPEVESPTISFLNIEGVRGNVLFIADNTPISFEVYPDSLYASEVKGGKDNQILREYANKMKASQEEMGRIRSSMMKAFSSRDTMSLKAAQNEQNAVVEQMKADKKELVKNNPNSIISLMVMQEMVNSQMFPTSELKELYGNISPELRETPFAQNIKKSLNNLSAVEIGSKAPNFSAPTPEGEELALNDVLGKVTLIDFWASWCKPCRVENPNIVRVYEKYHDKGFNAIGVSLDRQGQKDKWVQAIKEDNLQWAQVSNLQFWQDPIAAKYNVRSIPAAFLLDENGVIVARNLRGEDLENKVAELLGEE